MLWGRFSFSFRKKTSRGTDHHAKYGTSLKVVFRLVSRITEAWSNKVG